MGSPLTATVIPAATEVAGLDGIPNKVYKLVLKSTQNMFPQFAHHGSGRGKSVTSL